MDDRRISQESIYAEDEGILSETESISEDIAFSGKEYSEDDRTLDCKGLPCPMPIIKTKKTLSSMNTGEILRIETTCKNSKSNMHAFTTKTENELLEIKEENNAFIFYIRKK